jgi:hypothetical protein
MNGQLWHFRVLGAFIHFYNGHNLRKNLKENKLFFNEELSLLLASILKHQFWIVFIG